MKTIAAAIIVLSGALLIGLNDLSGDGLSPAPLLGLLLVLTGMVVFVRDSEVHKTVMAVLRKLADGDPPAKIDPSSGEDHGSPTGGPEGSGEGRARS